MQSKYEMLIQGLLEKDFGSVDNLFPEQVIVDLRKILMNLYIEDQFKLAGIGNRLNELKEKAIRNDRIFWLNRDSKEAGISGFYEVIEHFIAYLNRTCFTAIRNSEFHFAVYPKGSFYKRHLDQFQNDDSRRFSFILYLNEDWKEEDGGQLVLYKDLAIEIAPFAGRVMFFDSSKMEHEVLVANRDRLSLTGWFKNA